ncbi:hypothetical protein CR513_37243, partial [Mucuna pruriens]
MRLLGKAFTNQKVVRNIMVSMREKFEAKISAIEESCDMQTLTITELTSKLHVRVSMRSNEAIEGAFQTRGVKLNGYDDNNLGQEIDVQFANIMTKALPKSNLKFFKQKFGMFMANLKEEC